jgi:hypothetical protein
LIIAAVKASISKREIVGTLEARAQAMRIAHIAPSSVDAQSTGCLP